MTSLLKKLALGAFAVGLSLAGPQAADAQDSNDIHIIVVTHGQANDPFWSVVKNGVEQAAKDTGVNVDYRAPETFDMVAMSQLIDAAVNQEPDGLVVSIPDADALGAVDQARRRCRHPGHLDEFRLATSRSSSARCSMSARTEYDAGKTAGEKLAEMGGKKALCVNQEVGNVSLDLRCDGFAEGLRRQCQGAADQQRPDRHRGQGPRRAAVGSGRSTRSWRSARRPPASPRSRRVKSLGKTKDVNVASFDLSANFLKAVADGDAAFAIDQQQFLQGYLPVVFLALKAKYGLMPAATSPPARTSSRRTRPRQVIDLSAKGIR